MEIERFRTGLVFVLRLNTIFDFKYRASTRPRLKDANADLNAYANIQIICQIIHHCEFFHHVPMLTIVGVKKFW